MDNHILLLINMPLIIALLVLSYQDIRECMIYNWIPILGVLIGLVLNIYFYFEFFPTRSLEPFAVPIAFFSLWFLNFMYRQIKNTGENAIGEGDMLVFAMIGAFLGLESLYFVLLFACIFAVIFILIMKFFGKKQNKIPFVPFLSLGVLAFISMELF